MTGTAYEIITIVNNVIIFVFQVCLILIFNKLVSVAVEQLQQDKKQPGTFIENIETQSQNDSVLSPSRPSEVYQQTDNVDCVTDYDNDHEQDLRLSQSSLNKSNEYHVKPQNLRYFIKPNAKSYESLATAAEQP